MPDPTRLTISQRAEMLLEARRRREREALASRYDWYGGPCACGLALGECRVHERARPSQRPPESDWDVWLIEAGRGFGKTRTGAEYVRDRIESGAWRHVALVNETVKDVRDVMIEGESGLLAIAPPWDRPIYEPSKARVTWPSGATATIYSAEQPTLLRGPQFHGAWVDELAKFKHAQQETWDMLQFGLRLGDHPRVVVTTTPQPTPTYKAIRSHPRTAITRGPTYENRAHLAGPFLARIEAQYAGTRMGRQEIEAELCEDVSGALWSAAMIDAHRVRSLPAGVDLVRIVVGVDPGVGSNDPESAAETGIVAAGKGDDGHGYVLADLSCKGSPEAWASRVVDGFHRLHADLVAGEANNGGDMIEAVLRAAPRGSLIPYKKLWASRGKHTRAEPVSRLYEQGRVHHVGEFPALEAQMTSWVPGQPSPDRMDACVWAITEVMLGGGGQPGTVLVAGDRDRMGHAAPRR